MNIRAIAQSAKEAAIRLAACDQHLKNQALEQIALTLEANKEKIIHANQEDLKRSEEQQLAAALLKRLKFDEAKLADVVAGIRSLIRLEDPVGKTLLATWSIMAMAWPELVPGRVLPLTSADVNMLKWLTTAGPLTSFTLIMVLSGTTSPAALRTLRLPMSSGRSRKRESAWT